MLRNLFGKSKNVTGEEEYSQVAQRIARMNLSDMRMYVKNSIKDFEISIDGLNEVMNRLVSPINEKGEYYLKVDDMDSKKKKAFELVLLVSNSKRISMQSIELIKQFIELYKDMIRDFDQRNKDIYVSRLKDAIETAIINIQTIATLHNKLDVLK